MWKEKGPLKLHCPIKKKSGMTKPEDVRTVCMSSMTLTSVFVFSAENYPENWLTMEKLVT